MGWSTDNLPEDQSASVIAQLGTPIRSGTKAQVEAYTPAIGEMVWDTTSNILRVGDGTTAGGVAVNAPEALYRYTETAGTAGDTLATTTWTKVALGEELFDDIGISIASSVLTLPAGTYRVEAECAAFQSDQFKIRLFGNSTTLRYGQSAHSRAGASGDGCTAVLRGDFTLASEASDVELQYYAAAAGTMGVATNASVIEVYAYLKLQKVA